MIKTNNAELPETNISCKTAVLLVVFNRPDTTRQVFESIRAAKPSKLYLAADGPRAHRNGEAQLVEKVRQIVSNVDWPCDVKTSFRVDNIGCQRAVTSAIDWIFEHEDRAIILEDDCVPNLSFYRFCDDMLETYQSDESVMHISGYTVIQSKAVESYRASKVMSGWGWATWRRAWKNFDLNIDYENVMKNLDWKALFGSQSETIRLSLVNQITNTQLSVWDVQWFLTLLNNNGVCIIPSTSLVKNVGFGPDATHTREISHMAKVGSGTMSWPLIKPLTLDPDPQIDEQYLKKVYRGADLVTRVVRKLQIWARG